MTNNQSCGDKCLCGALILNNSELKLKNYMIDGLNKCMKVTLRINDKDLLITTLISVNNQQIFRI